jgi:hypothetical protein
MGGQAARLGQRPEILDHREHRHTRHIERVEIDSKHVTQQVPVRFTTSHLSC